MSIDRHTVAFCRMKEEKEKEIIMMIIVEGAATMKPNKDANDRGNVKSFVR